MSSSVSFVTSIVCHLCHVSTAFVLLDDDFTALAHHGAVEVALREWIRANQRTRPSLWQLRSKESTARKLPKHVGAVKTNYGRICLQRLLDLLLTASPAIPDEASDVHMFVFLSLPTTKA